MRYHIRHINPDNTHFKRLINHCWGKRNKLLNQLSRYDSEKYELIKKTLRIEHSPALPGVPQFKRIMRKPELRRLTEEYCDKIKTERINEVTARLEATLTSFPPPLVQGQVAVATGVVPEGAR